MRTLDDAKREARGLAKRGNEMGWPVSAGKMYSQSGWRWAIRIQPVAQIEQVSQGMTFEPVATYRSRSVARRNPVGSDAPPTRQKEAMALLAVLGLDEVPLLASVLAALRALVDFETAMHWQASGNYADHLLFQRLYEGSAKDVDALAERTVALYGPGAVDPASQLKAQKIAMDVLDAWTPTPSSRPHTHADLAYAAESRFAALVEQAREVLDAEHQLTPGLDNLLGAIADRHEQHLYLLRQRVAPTHEE